MKFIIRLFLFITMMLFCCLANAQPTVGVILDAPLVLTENDKNLQKLDAKLKEIFPSDKCNLLPSKELTEQSITYRSAHNMMLVAGPDMRMPLTRGILCELGKQANCDYVLLIDLKPVGKKESGGMISRYSDGKSMVVAALSDIQVVNVLANKYEYKKQVISLGVDSVTKVFGIGRNPKEDKAIEKLFTKGFLEKLTIKPSAIP